jgi:AraC-like DNA-binding protein
MIKYFVNFVGGKAVELLRASPLSGLEPVQLADPFGVIEIFEQLQYSGTMLTDFTQRICCLLLELLLLRISEQSITPRQATSRAWKSYRQCRQYIESRFLTIRSAQEAAEHCNIAPEYMCRLFRRFARQTPYQMLLRLKMGRAAELLLHSDMLIKQVADAVGFADPYHFSKIFKKVHGVSPRTFLIRISRQRRPRKGLS